MKPENKTDKVIELLRQFETEQSLSALIEELNLSNRIRHSLQKNGIRTIGDLVNNWERFPKFRNIGDKGVLEVADKLNLWVQKGDGIRLSGPQSLGLADQSSKAGVLDNSKSDSSIPVERLELSIRAYNVLKRHNINTVAQIYTEWEKISSYKNVGLSTMEQIQQALVALRHSSDYDNNYPNIPSLIEKKYKNLPSIQTSFSANENNLVVSVDELGLPLRPYHLLKRANFNTINLFNPDWNQIQSIKGMGAIALKQIQTAINNWPNRKSVKKKEVFHLPTDGSISYSADISINNYLGIIFRRVKPREKLIIEFRYGLISGKQRTLQETADQFGVTRERIRQIEKTSIHKICREVYIRNPSPLIEEIKNIIQNRGGVISNLRLAEDLKGTLADTDYQANAIVEFFKVLFEDFGEKFTQDNDLILVDILGKNCWTISSYSRELIFLSSNKILELLSSAEFPLQWQELYSTLAREDGLLTLDENLAHAIALCMSDNQQIQRQMDGGWSIIKSGRATRFGRIISVMKQIGQPTHFSEIAELYNQTYPEWPLSEHNLHAIIGRHAEFVRVGRGKYGLAEWGLHDDGNISNAARRILAKHKHPLELENIVSEVLETWDVSRSSIIAAIDIDARFSKTEDGKIWLTGTGLSLKKRKKRDDDTRGDRLLIVLRELGKPSPIQLIVDTHNSFYPERPLTVLSAKSLMYRRTELFIRCGSDQFGLAEWGLKPFQETLIDRKSEILEVIKEHGPIRFEALYELYNERYSDRPIGESSLHGYLGKLKGIISSPNKGEYQLADQSITTYQTNIPLRIGQKLVSVIKNIGYPSHVDVIAEKYKQIFPEEIKGYDQIRRALYNNRNILVNFGAGTFGLPGWEAPQNISHHPKQNDKMTTVHSQQDGRLEKILKIVSKLNHPPQLTIILERYNQLYPEDFMTMEGFMEYLNHMKDRSKNKE
jgi:DNA-directed RNA polymerase alpha subunit